MAALKLKKSGKKPFRFKLNKNWLMLIVAVVVGAFGIHAANAFIENQLQSFKEKSNKPQKMVKVVVPKEDLPRGVRITPEHLVVREVPEDYADKGAVTPSKYKVAIGQRLSYPVTKGKPLLWAHLESGSVETFAGRLPDGLRAISFSVDKINSISGFLQPKDRIDLLLTYTSGKQKITRVVLQNLLVLATDGRTQTEKMSSGNGKKSTSYGTLTVQVNPEEAKKIILAQDAGKITAVLRHPDDEKLMSKDAMTVSQLFSNKGNGHKTHRTGVEFIIGGSSGR